MQAGDTKQAMKLWQDVFNRYPSLIGPGLNLAIAQLNAGNASASETTLLRILKFHPDAVAARKLLDRIRSAR
jgi:hypothetical protein